MLPRFYDLSNTSMGFDPIPREPGDVAWLMGYQGLGVHVSRKQTTFRVTKIFSLFTNLVNGNNQISYWWSDINWLEPIFILGPNQ